MSTSTNIDINLRVPSPTLSSVSYYHHQHHHYYSPSTSINITPSSLPPLASPLDPKQALHKVKQYIHIFWLKFSSPFSLFILKTKLRLSLSIHSTRKQQIPIHTQSSDLKVQSNSSNPILSHPVPSSGPVPYQIQQFYHANS